MAEIDRPKQVDYDADTEPLDPEAVTERLASATGVRPARPAEPEPERGHQPWWWLIGGTVVFSLAAADRNADGSFGGWLYAAVAWAIGIFLFVCLLVAVAAFLRWVVR